MLLRHIELWYRNRLWTFLSFGLLAIAGVAVLPSIAIDAVPDITNVQVMIITRTGSLDPQQVEKSVTYPLESEMAGLPGLVENRSLSKYGLSQVILAFEDGTDVYRARQQVAERLAAARDRLPKGAAPEMAPVTTGLGEVLTYTLEAKPGTALAAQPEEERLLALRTAQDLVVRPRLKAMVPGIADVDTAGGYEKEIHVDVDLSKLEDAGLTLSGLVRQLDGLGDNVGGGYAELHGQQVILRSQGTLASLDAIGDLALKAGFSGRLVKVRDVAEVREGHVQRVGAATVNGEEAVVGTVLMLAGANSREVALRAEKALSQVELPQDMQLRSLYSRKFLVDGTIHTVAKNLIEGAILVIIVLLLLLGDLRAALLVACAIPLSMLMAALGMKAFGISASLMSLGAIDFGLLVDGSVVIVENVLRRMALRRSSGSKERLELVLEAVKEVALPVGLGMLLIMAVYVPILALQGIEGKVFRPMAETVLMALGSSLLVGLFLVPTLAYFVLRGAPEHEPALFRWMRRTYEPILHWSLGHRRALVLGTLSLGLLSLGAFHRLGSDFLPKLDEGDRLLNFLRTPGISLTAGMELQKESDKVLLSLPETETVVSKVGTAEAGLDPMGTNYSDCLVVLKKPSPGRVKDALDEAYKKALEAKVEGQETLFGQPVEERFNELLEGSRADVSVRFFGPDLETLADLADEAKEVLEKVPGTDEAEIDPGTALTRSPVLSLLPNRQKLARFGLNPEDLSTTFETAMAGKEVGSLYQGPWRFPVLVRLGDGVRDSDEGYKSIPVALPDGGTIPLGSLAEGKTVQEVTTIAHRGGERYASVAVFLKDRDIAGFVADAKKAVQGALKLPPGYRIEWGGQFKNLEEARGRLMILVPLILLAILLALVRSFGSLRQAAVVCSGIPFAMTGGALALAGRGLPFSISAAVGFIALSGIAILNTMVLVSFINQQRSAGLGLEEAVRGGTLARLRPVLMTALVASLGFLPMALNTGLGAEVQRPLATVVVGGLISSTALTLLVVPMLYLWVESRARSSKSGKAGKGLPASGIDRRVRSVLGR